MTQKISPFIEAKYGWDYGESGWNTGADENFLKFSYLFDRNVDSITPSLPGTVSGTHFLTTDNRFYFGVGGIWYSSPTPKWFIFTERLSGNQWQFDGINVIPLESNENLVTRLDAVELTLSNLGTAAYEDASIFATQDQLDVATAQFQDYADEQIAELGVVSVKQFGAVGDGVVDDTVAIQSCLDFLVSRGKGGIAFFPAGDYLISSTLNLNISGLTLMGEGADEGRAAWGKWPSRIFWAGSTNDNMIEIDSNLTTTVRGGSIQSLVIDAQNAAGVKPFYGNPNSSHWKLKNICLRNFVSHCYVGTSCYGWLFEDVEIFNAGEVGIVFEGLNHHTTFVRMRAAGVGVTGATSILRIGVSDRCSNINFVSCDWEATGTQYQVELLNCRAVCVNGGYCEWVAETLAIYRLGVTGSTACEGFVMSGVYVQGNNGLSYVLDVKNASGVSINGGNHFRNIVLGVVQSAALCPESSFTSGNHLSDVGGSGLQTKFATFSSGWTYFESGTKTVTLVGSTTAGTNTYVQNKLTYKIANGICTFAIELTLSSLNSVGALIVEGLPKACRGTYDFPVTVAKVSGATLAAGRVLTANVIRGTTQIDLKEQDITGSGFTSVLNTEVTSSFSIFIAGSYEVA